MAPPATATKPPIDCAGLSVAPATATTTMPAIDCGISLAPATPATMTMPPTECEISSLVAPPAATATATMPVIECGVSSPVPARAAPVFEGESRDLDGLSFMQILMLGNCGKSSVIGDHHQSTTTQHTLIPGTPGLVNGASKEDQFQANGASVRIDQEAIPCKVEENAGIPTPSKSKKRKIGVDLNKKPGEKRQNKYYWAKIDVQKVQTPKPRTPKPKTPKPVKKKEGKRNVKGSNILKHDLPETKKNSNCKRALNFEDCSIVEDVKEVKVLGVQHADVVKEVSNLSGGGSASKNGQGSLRVYRRGIGCKCLNQCRILGPNFLASCKRKRSLRNKKLREAFKQFEEFDYSLLLQEFFDRFTIMKGRTRMLLPTKVKKVQESFTCVLRLLSLPMCMRKKKRSRTRLISTSTTSKQTAIPDIPCCYPPVQEAPRDGIEGLNLVPKECELGSGQIHERLAISCCSSSNSCLTTELKTKVTKAVKEKTSKRPYKRKDKRLDYLSKLDDWNDASLEQIMDLFSQEFESLKLYDDPKKLERWSVMMSGQNNGGEAHEESAKFREETAILHLKILRFLNEMTKFQGRKEFVKWNGSVLDSVVGVFLTQNVSDVLSSNAYMELVSRYPIKPPTNQDEVSNGESGFNSSQESISSNDVNNVIIEHLEKEEQEEETALNGGVGDQSSGKEFEAALNDMLTSLPFLQGYKGKEKKGEGPEKMIDWEAIRVQFLGKNTTRSPDTQDSVDWEAVRKAPVEHIADAINHRGQHRIIAAKIQKALNRLVDKHGTLDLEWLREAPHVVAKAYLLSFYGLGLKSVECLRLLTLHHHGFPVDVNIGRIAIRLGWVPIKPLPVGLPFHLLEKYPLESEIQQYLWPKLRNLSQELLYQIHYQMITFGKVFCLKRNPNCRACPFKNECKYYKSVADSIKMKRPLLSWTKSKKSSKKNKNIPNPFDIKKQSSKSLLEWASDLSLAASLPLLHCNRSTQLWKADHAASEKCDPIIEFPTSPKKDDEVELPDIEDLFKDNEANEEFIVINLGTQKDNVPHPSDDSSRALVCLSSEAASMSLPKHINPARLRTEHQVYELPCNHLLLKDLDTQQGVIPYLLAIWTQGPLEKNGSTLEGCSGDGERACHVPDDCQTVLGTILIPVRTAMRGSFPLNGTYFQLNEVFADDETSQCPINVPTSWIWMLRKRTLYCGSGTSSIFRGLTEDEIQRCCLEGYICTRGFNRKTRAPKPLPLRFHNRVQVKGKSQQDEEED